MDTITINVNGEKKEGELVAMFKVPDKGDYVIYKLDNEYYGAKYVIEGNNTTLITDLTDEEKRILNNVFDEAKEE